MGGIEYLFFAILKSLPVIGAQINASGNPFDVRILAEIILFGESHLWFLRNLIVYHLTVFAFECGLKKKCLFPIVIVIFILVPIIIPTLDITKGIVKNYPYYLFGAGLACHYSEWFESSKNKKCAIISLFSTIALGLCLVFAKSSVLATLVRLSGSLLVWISASLLPVNKTTTGFITQSFFIYVSHVMVLECVEKLILILFKNTMAGAWIDFFIAPIITLSILFLFYLLLHPYERLWSFLTGSRN